MMIDLKIASYTKKQIVEISNLSDRQVQFYTEYLNILSIDRCHVGRGNMREYSEHELFIFKIIKKLRDIGLTTQKIREIISD